MTITSALNNALSGLRANSKMIEITSNNLANALTDGYGRQRVDIAARIAGNQGTGVGIQGVSRAEDPELTAIRRDADGNLAQERAVNEGVNALSRLLGQAGDTDGLFQRLTAFEDGLRQLGETPESAPRQARAAQAAADLADGFNQISTQTTGLRQTADAEIARKIEEVNSALRRIAQLNRQVQIFQANGQDVASLIDERERLTDQVAAIVPIRESRREDGVVELRTAQGLPLADIRAQEISFTPTPVLAPLMSYDTGSGALSGLSLNGIDVTPGGAGAQQIQGGALAGLFELRDQVIPEAQARLDSLAADLIERFVAPGVDPTLAPGNPGLFTDDGAAYDPTNLTGLAARIGLNPLADPAAGGNPALLRDGLGAVAPGPVSNDTIARNLLDALTGRTDAATTPGLGGQRTASERLSGVIELLETRRIGSDAAITALTGARETIARQEADRIGVDQDQELQELIRIEQAYAANAQVIQTASRMLDDLLRI